MVFEVKGGSLMLEITPAYSAQETWKFVLKHMQTDTVDAEWTSESPQLTERDCFRILLNAAKALSSTRAGAIVELYEGTIRLVAELARFEQTFLDGDFAEELLESDSQSTSEASTTTE